MVLFSYLKKGIIYEENNDNVDDNTAWKYMSDIKD